MFTNSKKYANNNGQTTFFIIILLILFISALGASVYFYYAKEKIMQFHLEKVEALNQKIITLSEYAKKREVESKESKNLLENTEKEFAEYKQKYTLQQDMVSQLVAIKQTLQEQFSSVNAAITSGFSSVNDFTMVFDSKLEDYLTRSKKELSKLMGDTPAAAPDTVVSEKVTRQERKAITSQQQAEVELSKLVVMGKDTKDDIEDMPVKYGQVNKSVVSGIKQVKSDQSDIKVMKVNQAHKFIVLNKGMIDGIKIGTVVDIMRNNSKIGRALINEVRELVSLAKIEEQYDGHFIEAGDMVQLN